jgi:hypothetical protein
MVAMRFDYRDLFRAPRVALSFQRLWIQTLGLVVGYILYMVLTYIALMLAGEGFGALWSTYGLLPCVIGIPLPWYSTVLFTLGVLLLVVAWLVTATAVSRAAYMHLKGNHFYTWKDAVKFAVKKKGGAVIATPMVLIVIMACIVLGGLVVGWFAKIIPWAGELGLSLFTLVWFMASLFLVFLALALGVSLLITPSVLATTDDDAFEGVFQSFSTLVSQPWRLVLYKALIVLLSAAGFIVLAFFSKQAWVVMNRVLMAWGGDKVTNLAVAASYSFQNLVYPAEWARLVPADAASYFFSQEFTPTALPLVMQIAAWILTLFLLVIAAVVASYPFATFNTGVCILYLVLKKKKDDENLLERKDKEEETEEDLKDAAEEKEPGKEKPKASKARPKRSAKSKPSRKK